MAVSLLADPRVPQRPPNSQANRVQKMSETQPASPYVSPLSQSGSARSLAREHPNPSVRRRVSKACDRCNQLRTRCDGAAPCKHCVDNKLCCEYVRERKKRGKASKKDLARIAVTPSDANLESVYQPSYRASTVSPSAEAMSETAWPISNLAAQDDSMHGAGPGVPAGSGHPITPDYHSGVPMGKAEPPIGLAWDDRIYGTQSASLHTSTHANTFAGRGDDMAMQLDDVALDPWSRTSSNKFPSSASSRLPSMHRISIPPDLKYPVLAPLLPHIQSIIPLSLAFELLEHYFSTSSCGYPHPQSPYIIAFMFGRRAFLRLDKPRVCSPALLASMLCIAARSSDAQCLSASPSSRGRACQKLLELTIRLLRPLIHRSAWPSAAGPAGPGYNVSGIAISDVEEPLDPRGVDCSANGTLDDVATYIHLGIVVSASEYKGASLRWWNAAWGLARELRLGRELPPGSASSVRHTNPDPADNGQHLPQLVPEEEREERRRIWWLLYCMDRHLALCYNKPICLPDRECETLLQPMDERSWQAGDFGHVFVPDPASLHPHQSRGPPVTFTGPSLFGYFLPLMAILGEVVDLNHSRSHPRFGSAFINADLWTEQARIINLRLENFERSIHNYEAHHSPESFYSTTDATPEPSGRHGSQASFGGDMPQHAHLAFEALMQQKKAILYATHIMHVLHILLTGRWDPIALLDDTDMWICSQSFVNATGHAVSAAEFAGEILEQDPGVAFMPFLYGIYLLQGSFLLLLMADKLQRDAAPKVVQACETIVRAHEACAVQLNTEYQRNFCKVMRSALSQAKGFRPPDDNGEEQARRRKMLGLYRWTGDGTGLSTE